MVTREELIQKYTEEYPDPADLTEDELEFAELILWTDSSHLELEAPDSKKAEAALVIQFHMLGQHDQLTHAPVSSKGGGINEGKIAAILAGTALAAGLVYTAAKKKAPATFKFSNAYKHSVKLENLVAKGGKELDDAILHREAQILAGKNIERNTRDLAVLKNKTFLHADDHAKFLLDHEANPYTDDEAALLWKYGGAHRDPLKGPETTGLTKGPFRIHGILRAKVPMSRADANMVNGLDRIIKKNGLPRDVTLYRGMPVSDAELAKLAKMKPGTIMSDPAYSFVGLTEARAKPHYWEDSIKGVGGKYVEGRNNPVLIVIDAPKGLPAVSSPYGLGIRHGASIPVPRRADILGGERKIPKADSLNISAPVLSHLNKEEMVLRRNQRFMIVGSETREDGVLIVRVRALLD